ncbi:Arb2 domain-containing protein [Polychytrium aggregatum]|uniref:Arb2 domain-containing protein n=1 Tax=Polychytrium aggregatum TaxID=110093 RepID=UPI0022FEBAC9|nr:Arb2 domain-containing protein [Polychytrium aggregatum]KAI9199346.1 Arb2 domain-containing protein [Polychytrium aggregatum]
MTDASSPPRTLSGFGYHFNDAGELRNIKTGRPFEFNISNNPARNQEHYEAVGDAVAAYIEEQLVETLGLLRKIVPVDATPNEPTSKIFMSPNALTAAGKLLVLIPGINIRVGQWARKIVMNDNINKGSVFDYVRQGQSEGYEIMVLNNNENIGRALPGTKRRPIRGSESPERHVEYVFDSLIKGARAAQIFVVAHSFGGHCIARLVSSHQGANNIRARISAIAFTDSVHSLRSFESHSPDFSRWFQSHARNWVRSSRPLDTPIAPASLMAQCPCVSAGHEDHGYTTVTAIDSVFEFFAAKDSTGKRKQEAVASDESDHHNDADNDDRRPAPLSRSGSEKRHKE